MSSIMSVPDAAFANYALQYKAPSKTQSSSQLGNEDELRMMEYNLQYGFFKEARDWALKILQPMSTHNTSNREIAEKVKNRCFENIRAIKEAVGLLNQKKFEEVVAILQPIFNQYPHLSEVSSLYGQAVWFAQIKATKLYSSSDPFLRQPNHFQKQSEANFKTNTINFDVTGL